METTQMSRIQQQSASKSSLLNYSLSPHISKSKRERSTKSNYIRLWIPYFLPFEKSSALSWKSLKCQEQNKQLLRAPFWTTVYLPTSQSQRERRTLYKALNSIFLTFWKIQCFILEITQMSRTKQTASKSSLLNYLPTAQSQKVREALTI